MEEVKKLFEGKCQIIPSIVPVKDLFWEKMKCLFILESPHTHEMCKGYPAAGGTGKAMTKSLDLKSEEALGCLICNGKADTFGVMNVCQYPMQFNAITDWIRRKVIKKENVEKWLNDSPIKHKCDVDETRPLIKEIYGDFDNRLSKCITSLSKDDGPKLIIVPCGEFARAFFEYWFDHVAEETRDKASYPDYAKSIPHPASVQWKTDKSSVANLVDGLQNNRK